MEVVVAKARKWGNSIGVRLPADVIKKEGIKDGEEVELIVSKPRNVIKEMFGAFKGKGRLKISTDELMRETDRDLYND